MTAPPLGQQETDDMSGQSTDRGGHLEPNDTPEQPLAEPDQEPAEAQAPLHVDLSNAITAALAAVERRPQARESTVRDATRAAPREESGRTVELLLELAEERRQTAILRAELAQALGDVTQSRRRFQKLDQDQEEVRKRLQRAEMDLPLLGGRTLLLCLLPALDDLDAVLEHLTSREELTAQGLESIEMLRSSLQKALQAAQVQTFGALGQRFDPVVHEVIAQVDAPGQPAGTVVRQAGRGYLLAGKLLRSARVVVSKG